MKYGLTVVCAALLLASPQLAKADEGVPPAAPAPSNQTVIHPGDQISVQVFGDQTLTTTVTVLDDGTIDYPLIGSVEVAGRTPPQAASLLSQRLLKYVRHPVVSVSIAQLGQPWVLVLGDVKSPGKYQLRSNAQLTDAIAAAGGIDSVNGELPVARVADASGAVTTISLQKLLHDGDMSQNISLGEGSVVYVPGPVQFTVDVAGAVDHPGDVQVNQGDHLSAAIARAGDSANSKADLNHIRLIRTNPDGTQTTEEINLYKALKGGDESVDVALQKGDVIYVPQASTPNNWWQASPILYYLGLLTRVIP